MKRYGVGPTLTETLAAAGLAHGKVRCRPGYTNTRGSHDIWDAETGEVVFTGTAGEAWAWLKGDDDRDSAPTFLDLIDRVRASLRAKGLSFAMGPALTKLRELRADDDCEAVADGGSR